jgi:hypothetical protein
MNRILTFHISRWDGAVCRAMAIASSVDLLGRYANYSGFSVSGKMEVI